MRKLEADAIERDGSYKLAATHVQFNHNTVFWLHVTPSHLQQSELMFQFIVFRYEGIPKRLSQTAEAEALVAKLSLN